MRFDKPLGVGAMGGHGPVRYVIEVYESAERIVFRFTSPKGFDGTHGFEVVPAGQGTRLRHFLSMRVRGTARIAWPTVFRPLHDALIEDALDKAERSLGFTPVPHSWPLTVRLLRRALRRI
jgi:carbon monoxide dehydrogenase subunit G